MQDSHNESLTSVELQDRMSNSKFNKLLKVVLCKDLECYFLILSQDSAKLPPNFDVSQLVEDNQNGASASENRYGTILVPRSPSSP